MENREIKFRGLAKNIDEWVYGYYFKGVYYETKAIKSFISKKQFKDGEFVHTTTYLVYENTIGEYTGLKDKNGKEIYEGDILKLNGGAEDFYGDVLFENGCFVFNAHWVEDGNMKPELYHYTQVKFVDCEVIGNIHQHPELLEK